MNQYIEHTLLKQDATKSEIKKLLDEAKEYRFLGVCVNPSWVKFASDYLHGTDVKVVTVIGFPLGQTTTEAKVLETIDAVKNGADEIDMVLNAGKLKDGEDEFIINEISSIKGASQGKNLKVILETDLLTQEEIKHACELSIKGGADFVKTSTGFVKNGVGAKAAGGIRDKEAAEKMIKAGATRLGTSSGVKICL